MEEEENMNLLKKFWDAPYLLLMLAALFWGGNAVAGRFLADSLPPLTLSLVRLSLSTAIIVPFIYPLLKKEWSIAKQNYNLILLLAVTGVIGFNLLAYWAAHYTTAVNIALLNSTTPIFMVFLAYFFIQEKMRLPLFLSIIVSLGGMLWILTQGSMERLLALQFNGGDLIVLLAVFCWSVYSIFVKKTVGVFSPLSLFGFSSLLGTMIMIPAAAIELMLVPIGQIGLAQWIGYLYIGIFPSIGAFLFWNRAVILVGPSRSAIAQNLIPVWGVLLAFLLLGEKITGAHLAGGALVFIGVLLSKIGNKAPQAQSVQAKSAAGHYK
jgi:drug/metabolite transporter (DMT)-like permease